MHNIFQMKLLLTSGIAPFSHINLYFGLDTEGNSQLTVAPVIGGIGQEVRYTYQITSTRRKTASPSTVRRSRWTAMPKVSTTAVSTT